MGYIYTGFVNDNTYTFKVGMTESNSPLGRIYANHLCDTGCIEVPNASKATLLLLESVARYTLENECGLSYWDGRTDFFQYHPKDNNHYDGVVKYANAVLNAVVLECESRNIEYSIHLEGFTMLGKFVRLFDEEGNFHLEEG
jgi:hypothetical protein